MCDVNDKSKKIDFSKIISSHRLKSINNELILKQDDEEYKKDENYKSDKSDECIRSPFNRDYDRIIFSQSFRKLSGKTQVHPLTDNDTIHNRLTHSLETASVGRSLGLILGNFLSNNKNDEYSLPEGISALDIATIVQSACLAHDLGNPPFGHAGEYAISNWFKEFFGKQKIEDIDNIHKREFESFDGNGQGFRIVCKLENNFGHGGMNLTASTLAAMIKYPYNSNIAQYNDKTSVFFSERNKFYKIWDHLELIYEKEEDDKKKKKYYLRHPLSYLMEAADDICYAFLDIVDAIELKIIKLVDIIDLYRSIINDNNKVDKILNSNYLNETRKAQNLTALIINILTLNVGNTFCNNISRFLNKNDVYGITDLISLDSFVSDSIKKAKDFGKDRIYNEKNKSKIEISAYEILGNILDNYVNAVMELKKVKNGHKLSYKNEKILNLMGIYKPSESSTLYEMFRAVVDFVSGMTDRYAISLFQQLNGISTTFRRL